MSGYLVLENKTVFKGHWLGGKERAGEVVFNTSHSGYEEMATDPSYFSQIIVMTAPMQGNYGADRNVWESSKIHIQGFVCLEIQKTNRENTWLELLKQYEVPILEEVDTRRLVMKLRSIGTTWGALVQAQTEEDAIQKAMKLISKSREIDLDWAHLVSRKATEFRDGFNEKGPRVAVIDFGCKENILREIQKRSSKVAVFPSRVSAREVKEFEPHGVVLTNGPGDPKDVQVAVGTIQELLGWKPIFGICMGHQLLTLALGGSTYKLKFGHRGSNHPIQDKLLNQVYMTSQNHGYAADGKSLPPHVEVTHTNLYDQTVAGIQCKSKKCFSVQFHPENSPGPRDAIPLFDYFFRQLI